MKTYDLIVMCMQNLMRRKVRTMLTVTGVVVGTCAIVVMISIGVGMQQSMDEMLAGMGDLTIIEVNKWGEGVNGKEVVLDDDALATMQQMPGVQAVTPLYYPYNIGAKFIAGKNDRYTMNMGNVVGIYPEALSALGIELIDGNGFEVETIPPYGIVYGEKAAYNFRDSRKKPGYDRVDAWPDANGKVKDPFVDVKKDEVIIRTNQDKENAKTYDYELVYMGTMKEDYGKGYETSSGAYMNIRDLKKIEADYNKANGIKKTEDEGYEQAKVKVANIEDVAEVQEAIEAMGFGTWSMESIRKPMEEQARQQQMVLGGLGAISLFVAALGITNTMVMSIYERTREIGVMKVLGCFVGDIRTVFLMEAGTIGFVGGVIGILISYFISFLMNFFGFSMGGVGSVGGMGSGASVSVIPPWLVVMGLVFATCIGLVSGFYPANRAVKISALEAIKTDG